jgi:hypothetical protein
MDRPAGWCKALRVLLWQKYSVQDVV